MNVDFKEKTKLFSYQVFQNGYEEKKLYLKCQYVHFSG